jgi:RHS repeat-associated protein
LDRVVGRNGVDPFRYAGFETDPVTDGTANYQRSPSGAILGISRNGVNVLALSDRHGDLFATINAATGVVADTSVVDPFGKPLGSTGTKPNVGFQADWTDPTTGLVWMAARWYNPATATFTSRDSYAGEVGAYATLNRYTYGLNNPLFYADPTGHFSGGEFMSFLNGTVDSFLNFSYGVDNTFTNGSERNVVWGSFNQISGDENNVVGNENVVRGDGNAITGSGNIVLGSGNAVSGAVNIVVGDINVVTGSQNVVVGDSNEVRGSANRLWDNDKTIIGSNTRTFDPKASRRAGWGKRILSF